MSGVPASSADLRASLFVPIPPSKSATHPDYDPRMLDVARAIGAPAPAVELLVTVRDRDALHEHADRRDPAQLAASMRVDRAAFPADVERIILLDDMLTTGCTFRACTTLLREQFPVTPISGLSVSRHIPPPPVDDEDAPVPA